MSTYDKYIKNYQKTKMGKYIRQRANAKARGIEWNFTFESWWEVWENSGKWEQRGKQADDYCMARKLDWGPYEPKNVKIIKNKQNSKNCIKWSNFPLFARGAREKY